MKSTSFHHGFVSLFAIIIIGSIAFAFAVNALLQSVIQIQNTMSAEKAHRTKVYSDSCAEAALQVLANNQNYSGTQTLTFDNGTCVFTISGSATKVVDITATVSQTVRKLTLTVDDNGVTWKENR